MCMTAFRFRPIRSASTALPGGLMLVRKTGGHFDALGHRRHQGRAARISQRLMPAGVTLKPIFDQSIFVKAALNSVLMGGTDGGRADRR